MKPGQSEQENGSQQLLINELKDIKSLLVLLLVKGGATQGEIAKALSTSQPTVSRQFPFGAVKPLGVEVVVNGTED